MVGLPIIEPYPMPRAEELPASIPPWRPDPERIVLLIHDMQSYFLRPFPDGSSPRDPLVSNVGALRARCAALGAPVAYSAQPGGMTSEQRGLLSAFWGPGMYGDPVDRQIVTPLAPAPGDWLLTKWRYSAFFRSDLLRRLRAQGRDQLVVCGVYAHIGVLMTAVEAFTNDIETFLVADGIADFTEESHWLALRYAAVSCAVVATTEWVLAALGDGHGCAQTAAVA
jgi:trans-2,3-dihydro-3-hydroxyanthranilic acid synthase